MAKGNLFLGDARGSVGDVTFYRKSGQQVSRQRIRNVSNPSSEGQLIQRAITATVAKAYQAGAAIFDHAFQGVKRGADSQARFFKVNMNDLRRLAVEELNDDTLAEDGRAVVVARGAVYPVPWTYRVSEGQLFQNLFSIAPQASAADMLEASLAAAGAATTLGSYCAENGLVAEDIFTLVGFAVRDSRWFPSSPSVHFMQFEAGFGFIRLKVKDSAVTSSISISSATLGDLFEAASADAASLDMTQLITAKIPLSTVVVGAQTGTMGVIRSRDNSGERSTCDLVAPEVMRWGVKMAYLYGAWNPKADRAGQSSLILEGGGF